MRNHLRATLVALCCSSAILVGCGGDNEPGVTDSKPARFATEGSAPNYAPPNPYLADSVLPVGHVNSAQSTGMDHAGPSGPTEELSQENGGLTYTHIGPGHFGAAISPPYPHR